MDKEEEGETCVEEEEEDVDVVLVVTHLPKAIPNTTTTTIKPQIPQLPQSSTMIGKRLQNNEIKARKFVKYVVEQIILP